MMRTLLLVFLVASVLSIISTQPICERFVTRTDEVIAQVKKSSSFENAVNVMVSHWRNPTRQCLNEENSDTSFCSNHNEVLTKIRPRSDSEAKEIIPLLGYAMTAYLNICILKLSAPKVDQKQPLSNYRCSIRFEKMVKLASNYEWNEYYDVLQEVKQNVTCTKTNAKCEYLSESIKSFSGTRNSNVYTLLVRYFEMYINDCALEKNTPVPTVPPPTATTTSTSTSTHSTPSSTPTSIPTSTTTSTTTFTPTTTPPPPTQIPTSPPPKSCKGVIESVIQTVSVNVVSQKEYLPAMKMVREQKNSVETFIKCVVDSPGEANASFCKNLADALRGLYLRATFSSELDELRGRALLFIESVKEIISECALQPFSVIV
eukprot:TRINITY_DN2550_c0_g1_i1.p1 TRINITY_DN2550_c0_g1~~TRINITY_DN2550_c0_g1_i1.p1  ORF type:complete len:374 (-),score=14.22 TRINITY_DN2550_c0_g1_i1:280-1401(-)